MWRIFLFQKVVVQNEKLFGINKLIPLMWRWILNRNCLLSKLWFHDIWHTYIETYTNMFMSLCFCVLLTAVSNLRSETFRSSICKLNPNIIPEEPSSFFPHLLFFFFFFFFLKIKCKKHFSVGSYWPGVSAVVLLCVPPGSQPVCDVNHLRQVMQIIGY